MSMPEARPEGAGREIPRHVGAVFDQSIVRPSVYDYVTNKDLLPVLDIRKPQDRMVWALENIRVFSDGTLSRPEMRWKPVVDEWLTDLKTAASKVVVVEDERKWARELELDIKAMMAVSSSARAMEVTGGSAAIYVSLITASENGDLDKQDSWAEFLLHKDSEKLARVVNNPLVRFFYCHLLEDAGFSFPREWKDASKPLKYEEDIDRPGKLTLDVDKARSGPLVGFLRSKAPPGAKDFEYRGGFDAYIADLLANNLVHPDVQAFILDEGFEKNIDTTSIWAAAKLACDAFLVDKYAKWEYEVTDVLSSTVDDKWENSYQLKPFAGWGGNPLTSILMPSFLPRDIKKVYLGKDKAVLDLIDSAFRPVEALDKIKENKRLPASMVGNLKNYARYNDALWRLLGGSRAPGIPQWTNKIMQEELPTIVELLDQVYGGLDNKDTINPSEPENIGKHMVGLMVARLLQCKALATAVESAKPGFKEKMRILFDAKGESRPFLEVLQFLWGPDLDAKRGFLVALTAGRTRLVFRGNEFKEVDGALKDAWELLSSNDQDPNTRGRMKRLNTIGFILDSVQAFAKSGKK